MPKRITAHLEIQYTPLPAERIAAYWESHRILHELAMFACKQSHPAQGGSVPGCPPQPGQVHPEADATNPLILLNAPAGAVSSSLQAKTTTGFSG